ncbi:DNA-binding protein RHL1 isoform X2 [Amborella trichopoda]|uniref:DNA-binding protein RHL1 n=1 Tax=Amborella trichopoda TaxID=13333 RepID=W1PMX9_AMBTC|nr:DNA-binding protein RHL1 isoform X2 [Amborella trichopoda]ERN09413.1 hypothetical protein AMTR_s00029p00053440 [Amborella trichopoda]|eukprot:XP_006847832.1 DNA-binding protein RHL1 isoform X2 [Amborella trichopoda]
MVRAPKSAENGENLPENREVTERKKLKHLALSQKLLSRAPAKPSSPLEPSKMVTKQDGRDIVKKGHRKSKFLFAFPGLLAPVSGGKIGELADLGSKNPILYIDFPQGRMKLFGTIVYPKNKYLTLQFARGSKNVSCEDSFENLVVFSDAWWIGKKEANPEELQLEFPKELEAIHSDFDFKGGVGATTKEKSGPIKPNEPLSPKTKFEIDDSDNSSPLSGENSNGAQEEILTPIRHSARTAGRTFKYVDSSSGDDFRSKESGSELSETEQVHETKEETEKMPDVKKEAVHHKTEKKTFHDPHSVKDENGKKKGHLQAEAKPPSSSLGKSKERDIKRKVSLVQATLSNFLDKVDEQKPKKNVKASSAIKASFERRQSPRKSKIEETHTNKRVKTDTWTIHVNRQKPSKVDHDDVEVISSDSQATNGNDEDWLG